MCLFWGLIFILGVFSKTSPLWLVRNFWSCLPVQRLTSKISVQLTTVIDSLLGLCRSCAIYVQHNWAKDLKGPSNQISGAPFLWGFLFYVTLRHKFQITQQPPQLSKSAVFLGSFSMCCGQRVFKQKARASPGVLPTSQESHPILPVVQCLKIVASYVFPCFIVIYVRLIR